MPTFSRVTFVNGSATPAINADNLNAIETFLQYLSDYGVPPPIGYVYFQGPADDAPSSLWPGTTWTDASWEEIGTSRRSGQDVLGNAIHAGTPAQLTITVSSGVPSIAITSGGSGYLAGSSGTLTLTMTGACTTQWVGTATVTSGVITAITTTTAGAGYTSGACLIYDNYFRFPGKMQGHRHSFYVQGAGSNNGVGRGDGQSPTTEGYATNNLPRDYVREPIADDTNGTPRTGPETTTAYTIVTKWRRSA